MSDDRHNKPVYHSDDGDKYVVDQKYSVMSEEDTRRKYAVANTLNLFSAEEKRNIAIYIAGIMLYKFGLEAFNGSIIALATNRYDHDAHVKGVKATTFQQVGLLQGLNQAFQCVGSILIAPLIKRFPTRTVLSSAILTFGLLSALLLIVDASTGGRIKPRDWSKTHKADDFGYYGTYNTNVIIPIFCITGVAYGMVELIRRVIPRDIVGGDVQKLRRMDALVHICYEIAGTAGAFCTALGLIPFFGNNMSFIITPVCFVAAAIVWFFISTLDFKSQNLEVLAGQPTYVKAVLVGFYLFYKSVVTGARIIFTSRKYVWLVPGYAFALYGHRYLENGIGPAIAKRYLGNSAWSQIMVGGSNFGELLGALFVFLFTNLIHTPMPWLRLDALALLIVWWLPFWKPTMGDVKGAWIVAATFLPISFGWAAGDVSLAAYIQALLQRQEARYNDVSPLGAVMAFLYSTYIIIYAVAGPLLGRYIDRVSSANNKDISPAIYNIAGVQFSVLSVVIIMATFIPKGAFKFNPNEISGQSLQGSGSEDGHGDGEVEFEEYRKEETFRPQGEDNYTAYVEADGSFDAQGRNRVR